MQQVIDSDIALPENSELELSKPELAVSQSASHPDATLNDPISLTALFKYIEKNWQSIFLISLCSWILIGNSYRGADTGKIHEDFQAFYNAGWRLNHHQPLYDWKNWSDVDDLHFARFSYDYTPTVAILSQPFACFSVEKAFWFWVISQILFFFGAVALFAKYAEISLKNTVSVLLCTVTGLHFFPTVCTFDVGQVNFLMLLLIVGVLLCQKKQKFIQMGALIGALACVKYWAIALIAFLVFQRKWQASITAVATFVFVTALQFAIVGWSEVSNFLIVSEKVVTQVNKALPSQSVFGFSRMLFSETAFSKPLLFENDTVSQLCSLALCGVLAIVMYAILKLRNDAPNAIFYKCAFALQTASLMLPACHIVYFIFSLPVLWTLFALPTSYSSKKQIGCALAGAALYLCGMRWLFPVAGAFTLSFFYWSVLLWIVILVAALPGPSPKTVR